MSRLKNGISINGGVKETTNNYHSWRMQMFFRETLDSSGNSFSISFYLNSLNRKDMSQTMLGNGKVT